MADYLDLTGLNHGERNTLQSNGGVGSLFGTLGGTMPYGAIPFALAGNMPASSWANSAATMLGAPIDAIKWAAQQAGVRTNLNGAPIADVPGGADTWRGLFGSLSGTPTPTQAPPPAPRPIASPFGVFPTNNGPTPQPPQQQQQPQDPSQGNPGDVAGFLGTPVDIGSYFLRKVGLPVPQNAPFGSESWQRMLDHYNQANRPMPPVTWDDIITAARRLR
jgi:hypothetical protein